MSDWLTCTGLPGVSAVSPPFGEDAATAAADADYDPDERTQALFPDDDAAGHVPGITQHPASICRATVPRTIVTPYA